MSLPLNSPDSYYFAVGLYGAFGIPIMALAMGNLASFFIDSGDMSDTLEAVTATVTAEEVENLSLQYITALKIGRPKILSNVEMNKVLAKAKNYKRG